MKRPTLRVLVISCALSLAALESVGILLHLFCHETCLNSDHFRIQVNSTTLRRVYRPREQKPTTYSSPTSTRVGELDNFEYKVRLSNPSTKSTTISSTTTVTETTVVPEGSSEGINSHAQLFAGVVPRMINSFIIRLRGPFQIGAKGLMLDKTIPARNQDLTLGSKPMSDFKPEKTFSKAQAQRPNATKKDPIKTNPIPTAIPPGGLIAGDKSEFWVKVLALMANLVLALGGYTKRPILYLPWMVIYGMEIVGGWAVGLTFVLFPEFHLAALCCLGRTIFLTWMWISLVRRHQKEVVEMVNRPRLQTIFSIMTAHPFSPRPELELSVRPPPPSFD